MVRLTSAAVTALAIFAGVVSANPAIDITKLGSLSCNRSRLKLVSAISSTAKNMLNINTQSDPKLQAAIDAATPGLAGVGQGIRAVADSIFANQGVPGDSNMNIGNNILVAYNALNGVQSNDPAVAAAKQTIGDAIRAGQSALTDCNGAGGPAPAPPPGF